MTTLDDNTAPVITVDPSELDQLRSNVLKAQIATYRLLARNLPVSDSLLNSCSYKSQLATIVQNHLQQAETNPTSIVLSNACKTNNQTNNDTPLTFSSATNMCRWLVGSNEINQEKTPHRIQQHPINLNPLYIQQEQDKR